MSSIAYAARVAEMFRSMNSDWRASWLGTTWKRWMTCGQIPPAATATSTSRPTPSAGTRQLPRTTVHRKVRATMTETTASSVRAGMTALTSVYSGPVIRSFSTDMSAYRSSQ